MTREQCGRIISVDDITELPDPIEVGKLYFVESTKEIMGDLGNGVIKYGDHYRGAPVPGTTQTLVAESALGALIGTAYSSAGTSKELFSYNVLESGYYSGNINIGWRGSSMWPRGLIRMGLPYYYETCEFTGKFTTGTAIVYTGAQWVNKNQSIIFYVWCNATFTIQDYSKIDIFKVDTIYV
jgi:hypothetical protein